MHITHYPSARDAHRSAYRHVHAGNGHALCVTCADETAFALFDFDASHVPVLKPFIVHETLDDIQLYAADEQYGVMMYAYDHDDLVDWCHALPASRHHNPVFTYPTDASVTPGIARAEAVHHIRLCALFADTYLMTDATGLTVCLSEDALRQRLRSRGALGLTEHDLSVEHFTFDARHLMTRPVVLPETAMHPSGADLPLAFGEATIQPDIALVVTTDTD